MPIQLKFSPDGTRVTYLRPVDEDDEILDLWAYDVAADLSDDDDSSAAVATEDLVLVAQLGDAGQVVAGQARGPHLPGRAVVVALAHGVSFRVSPPSRRCPLWSRRPPSTAG